MCDDKTGGTLLTVLNSNDNPSPSPYIVRTQQSKYEEYTITNAESKECVYATVLHRT
jgi:hypothetical protein